MGVVNILLQIYVVFLKYEFVLYFSLINKSIKVLIRFKFGVLTTRF